MISESEEDTGAFKSIEVFETLGLRVKTGDMFSDIPLAIDNISSNMIFTHSAPFAVVLSSPGAV
jgi:hypothetical protein